MVKQYTPILKILELQNADKIIVAYATHYRSTKCSLVVSRYKIITKLK